MHPHRFEVPVEEPLHPVVDALLVRKRNGGFKGGGPGDRTVGRRGLGDSNQRGGPGADRAEEGESNH